MGLSSYRKHKIYLAATMDYDLASEDPEELDYYNQIMTELNKDRGRRHMGVTRRD